MIHEKFCFIGQNISGAVGVTSHGEQLIAALADTRHRVPDNDINRLVYPAFPPSPNLYAVAGLLLYPATMIAMAREFGAIEPEEMPGEQIEVLARSTRQPELLLRTGFEQSNRPIEFAKVHVGSWYGKRQSPLALRSTVQIFEAQPVITLHSQPVLLVQSLIGSVARLEQDEYVGARFMHELDLFRVTGNSRALKGFLLETAEASGSILQIHRLVPDLR